MKVEVNENERREQVVLSMVQFAVAMMETLERFNKDALQEMRLRIGISVGPVIAGVVGASKPQCKHSDQNCLDFNYRIFKIDSVSQTTYGEIRST